MTLRQFERDAARKQEMRETQYLGGTHTKRDVESKQLKETEKDKNLLLVRTFWNKWQLWKMCVSVFIFPLMTWCDLNVFQAAAAGRGLMSEHPRVHTTTLQNSVVHRERQKPSERSRSAGAKVQVPADGKRCPNSSCVKTPYICTDAAYVTNGLSVSCQRDSCLFWRSSTLSALRW